MSIADPAIRISIGVQVRDVLARKGWTQKYASDKAGYDERVLRKILKGEPVRSATLHAFYQALSLPWPPSPDSTPPDGEKIPTPSGTEFGSYARETWSHYEGRFLCVRQGIYETDKIVAYQTEVSWSDDKRAFVFQESNPGYEQNGVVLIPPGANVFHFLTNSGGSARLITAYHAPRLTDPIRGVVLTLSNPFGSVLQPAASAIVMRRITNDNQTWAEIKGVYETQHFPEQKFVDDLREMSVAPILLK